MTKPHAAAACRSRRSSWWWLFRLSCPRSPFAARGTADPVKRRKPAAAAAARGLNRPKKDCVHLLVVHQRLQFARISPLSSGGSSRAAAEANFGRRCCPFSIHSTTERCERRAARPAFATPDDSRAGRRRGEPRLQVRRARLERPPRLARAPPDGGGARAVQPHARPRREPVVAREAVHQQPLEAVELRLPPLRQRQALHLLRRAQERLERGVEGAEGVGGAGGRHAERLAGGAPGGEPGGLLRGGGLRAGAVVPAAAEACGGLCAECASRRASRRPQLRGSKPGAPGRARAPPGGDLVVHVQVQEAVGRALVAEPREARGADLTEGHRAEERVHLRRLHAGSAAGGTSGVCARQSV